jgi:hypothetical protein
MNMVRNGIVHRGETYRGTRRELERYADLAESARQVVVRKPARSIRTKARTPYPLPVICANISTINSTSI